MEYWGKTTLFYKSRRKREVRRSLVDVLNTSLWSAEQWCRAEWAAGDQTRPENVDRVCNKHGDSPQSVPTDWTFNSTAVAVASVMGCRIPKRWVWGCWTLPQSCLRQVFSSSATGRWMDSSNKWELFQFFCLVGVFMCKIHLFSVNHLLLKAQSGINPSVCLLPSRHLEELLRDLLPAERCGVMWPTCTEVFDWIQF